MQYFKIDCRVFVLTYVEIVVPSARVVLASEPLKPTGRLKRDASLSAARVLEHLSIILS